MPKHLLFQLQKEALSIIPLNTTRKIQIKNKQYCLANTPKGFVAFQKKCPHAGGDLSKGAINIFHQIVCPLHACIFDLKSGMEGNRKSRDIEIQETIWEQDSLYVRI